MSALCALPSMPREKPPEEVTCRSGHVSLIRRVRSLPSAATASRRQATQLRTPKCKPLERLLGFYNHRNCMVVSSMRHVNPVRCVSVPAVGHSYVELRRAPVWKTESGSEPLACSIPCRRMQQLSRSQVDIIGGVLRDDCRRLLSTSSISEKDTRKHRWET